jgi:predicted ATP-grasp superfamily ATP-dependent carboligase
LASTVLITLGRLPKAIDLVRGFASAGCRVLVAEPFSWHLCRPSRDVARTFRVTAPAVSKDAYRDDLQAIIAREQVDLVVPVSEEILHVSSLHGALPDGVRLFAGTQDELLALHDKLNFIRTADSFGLPVPATAALGSAQASAIAEAGDFVVKPLYSCSGKGVQILPRGSALPAVSAPALVQRFLPGGVQSTFSLAHAGRVLCTAVYRGTVMSGTVSVCFERIESPAIGNWVREFVARTGHSGFISFDFVVDASGQVRAIECNPRVTSGIHFVDSTALARAILDPGATIDVPLRAGKLFQQFYPCLTEAQKAIFRPADRARHLHYLRAARDVVWSARDPLPFLTMTLTSYQILALSIFRGLSLGEASTRDIEWY